jgi:hypothetical protein
MKVVADFGPGTLSQNVRQVLHKRQTNLKSSTPVAVSNRDGILSQVDFELMETITKEEFMDWVLESMRFGYGGPPFVVAVEELPSDFVVADDLVGVQ